MNKVADTRSDAERYWAERLERSYSLDGVGWLGLGESFNRWMYAVRKRVFRRAVRGRVDPRRARILDVGSGTGFYVRLWQELGVRDVTGSDLTSFAVERLRTRFPSLRFEQLDIAARPLRLDGRFDAVSVIDVLFHIVDDARYAQAIRNLAALLVPGGVLVLTENLLHGDTARAPHQTSRTLHEVEELLGSAGLEIELRRPVFVLMNTPVDSRSALLRSSWRGIELLARHRLGWVAGALCYPLELLLTRVVREGPTTEIVVCRRLGREPSESGLRNGR